MDIKSNIDTLKASIDLNAKRFIAFQSKRVGSREIIKIIKKKRNVLCLLKLIAKWNKNEKTLSISCIQQCMQMPSYVQCVALDIPRSTT